jgi:hypothetical protein
VAPAHLIDAKQFVSILTWIVIDGTGPITDTLRERERTEDSRRLQRVPTRTPDENVGQYPSRTGSSPGETRE